MTFERIFMIQDNLPATTRRGADPRFNLTPGTPDKNATDITEFPVDVNFRQLSRASPLRLWLASRLLDHLLGGFCIVTTAVKIPRLLGFRRANCEETIQ